MSAVALSGSAWYVRLYQYVYGDLSGSAKSNFCPFFWKTGAALFIAPLIFVASFIYYGVKRITPEISSKSVESVLDRILDSRNSRLGDWILGNPVAQVEALITRAEAGDKVAKGILYNMAAYDWRLNGRVKGRVNRWVYADEEKTMDDALASHRAGNGFGDPWDVRRQYYIVGREGFNSQTLYQNVRSSIFIVSLVFALITLILTACVGVGGLWIALQALGICAVITTTVLGIVFGGPFIGYYVKHVIYEKNCPKITWGE